jgi:hypothetical protein
MLPWQVPMWSKLVNITRPWIWVPPKPVNNRRHYSWIKPPDLMKVPLALTRLETIALGHMDDVREGRRHLQHRKPRRRCVPPDSTVSAPGALRPGRLDPLHRDLHCNRLSTGRLRGPQPERHPGSDAVTHS